MVFSCYERSTPAMMLRINHTTLATARSFGYRRTMMIFVDMDDRARLRERFYGATRSVLARG
ncbi:MAG: hypothetical protein AAFV87_14985 [Pseudomonadota bacterium]